MLRLRVIRCNREKMRPFTNQRAPRHVYMYMTTMDFIDRHPDDDTTSAKGAFTDWRSHVRLALLLSIAAVLAGKFLAGHVAESTYIVGVIVVASFISWSQVAPVRVPVRVPATRSRGFFR